MKGCGKLRRDSDSRPLVRQSSSDDKMMIKCLCIDLYKFCTAWPQLRHISVRLLDCTVESRSKVLIRT